MHDVQGPLAHRAFSTECRQCKGLRLELAGASLEHPSEIWKSSSFLSILINPAQFFWLMTVKTC